MEKISFIILFIVLKQDTNKTNINDIKEKNK